MFGVNEHNIHWSGTRIIIEEQNWYERKFKEAMIILKTIHEVCSEPSDYINHNTVHQRKPEASNREEDTKSISRSNLYFLINIDEPIREHRFLFAF